MTINRTIRKHFSRIIMTMLLMLLTTATAGAQDAISGLTYNTAGKEGYFFASLTSHLM